MSQDDVRVLREDNPERDHLIASGWTIAARSYGARLSLSDNANLGVYEQAVAHARQAGYVLRQLGSEDLAALIALDEQIACDYPATVASHHEPLPHDTAERMAAGSRMAWGAFCPEGRLVAYTIIDRLSDRLEVDRTGVLPDFRRRGLARAVKAASILATFQDGARLWGTGWAAENQGAARMNLTLGFTPEPQWHTLCPPTKPVEAGLGARGEHLAALTHDLVAQASVSGSEDAIADRVEYWLKSAPHLGVRRSGNTIVAATDLGRPQRVVIAGHLDTVPISTKTHNVPGRVELRDGAGAVWGRGSVDMKGGVAVIVDLAQRLDQPRFDITWVLYDNEEVAADLNGLGRLMKEHPDWVRGDFAVLCEPTGGNIEGGCNGTLRLILDVPGVAAHSGRAWRGRNAIHAAGTLIGRVEAAPKRRVNVEGLEYRESFSVVLIEGGIATNTIPDHCRLTINYRFAPDISAREALARAWYVLAGRDPDSAEVDDHPIIDVGTGPVSVCVDDLCEAARPGLDAPLAADLVASVRQAGYGVGPKFGWTDVARFSAAGIPAVNLGPGDPMLCHTDDEHCPVHQLLSVSECLETWLS